ncbi:hypothetical protein MNBD_ALPHA07-1368, partial [hydrothermal vent metagenome]
MCPLTKAPARPNGQALPGGAMRLDSGPGGTKPKPGARLTGGWRYNGKRTYLMPAKHI